MKRACNNCRYWRSRPSDAQGAPVKVSECGKDEPVFRQCGSLKSPFFKKRMSHAASCNWFTEYDAKAGSAAEAIYRRYDMAALWPVEQSDD